MAITLLYGPGQVAKRSHLLGVVKKHPSDSVFSIDLKQKSLKDLEELIISRPMFSSGDRLIVIENTPKTLDLGQIPPVDSAAGLLFVADAPEKTSVLLKSAQLVKAQIISFEGEKEVSVFPFLDSLIEGKRASLSELEKLREDYGAPYILTMIYYMLRRNILPSEDSKPFVREKISRQKSRFKDSDWSKIYRQVIETEYKIKSGVVEEKLGLTVLAQSFITGDFDR